MAQNGCEARSIGFNGAAILRQEPLRDDGDDDGGGDDGDDASRAPPLARLRRAPPLARLRRELLLAGVSVSVRTPASLQSKPPQRLPPVGS
jgi:hypothetical protein